MADPLPSRGGRLGRRVVRVRVPAGVDGHTRELAHATPEIEETPLRQRGERREEVLALRLRPVGITRVLGVPVVGATVVADHTSQPAGRTLEEARRAVVRLGTRRSANGASTGRHSGTIVGGRIGETLSWCGALDGTERQSMSSQSENGRSARDADAARGACNGGLLRGKPSRRRRLLLGYLFGFSWWRSSLLAFRSIVAGVAEAAILAIVAQVAAALATSDNAVDAHLGIGSLQVSIETLRDRRWSDSGCPGWPCSCRSRRSPRVWSRMPRRRCGSASSTPSSTRAGLRKRTIAKGTCKS